MGLGATRGNKHTKGSGVVRHMGRTIGSGITPAVYQSEATRPTEVLRNIRVAKSRLPKKYITFE